MPATAVVTFYYRGVPSSGPGGIRIDTKPLVDRSFSEIPLLVEFLKSLSGRPPRVRPAVLPE